MIIDLTPAVPPASATPPHRFQQEVELGRCIGRMYIAAQHVSLTASDAACAAMEEAGPWMRWGFNQVLSASPYNVRAERQLESMR